MSIFHNEKLYSFKAIILLSLAMAFTVLKKLPIVEPNELGFIDNILTIAITLSLGILILFFVVELSLHKTLERIIGLAGHYSYELYLAHVLFLDSLFVKIGMVKYLSLTLMLFMILLLQRNCGKEGIRWKK